MLLMSMARSGVEPPTPPEVQGPPIGGGYPFTGIIPRTSEDRTERVRRERIKYGIIPDDVPAKASAIIEAEVERQLEILDREDEIEELKLAFHVKRVRYQKVYEEYYRAYLDALMTLEMRDYFQRQRRKRLMVFVLMNS